MIKVIKVKHNKRCQTTQQHHTAPQLTSSLIMKGDMMEPKRAIMEERLRPRERTLVGKSSEDTRYSSPYEPVMKSFPTRAREKIIHV